MIWSDEEVRQMKQPTPADVKSARAAVGLTQTQAAALIYKKLLAWQRYESGDRAMDYALYELFLLKTSQIDIAQSRETMAELLSAKCA